MSRCFGGEGQVGGGHLDGVWWCFGKFRRRMMVLVNVLTAV